MMPRDVSWFALATRKGVRNGGIPAAGRVKTIRGASALRQEPAVSQQSVEHICYRRMQRVSGKRLRMAFSTDS
jgi:hypothetical protein